jgi:hypothetical protein
MVFNSGGYYFWHLKQTARIQSFVQQRSLADIPVADLKIIKIPAALYTRVSDTEMEEIEGTVTDNGKTYQFIRRQIQNDTLILYCVNDKVQDQMNGFLNEYVQTYLADDSDAPQKSGQSKLVKPSLLKDFIPTKPAALPLATDMPTFGNVKTQISRTGSTLLSSDYIACVSPPPELA